MVNEVKAVEVVENAATEVAPTVEEVMVTATKAPSGVFTPQQAAIIIGSAAAGVGGYILITRVIVPKVKGAIDSHKDKKSKVVEK